MKNKYIDYKELIRKQQFKQDLEQRGFVLIPRKRLRVVAYVLIGVGVVTLPLPTGSILLIALGLSMLGLTIPELKEKLRKRWFRFKVRFLNN